MNERIILEKMIWSITDSREYCVLTATFEITMDDVVHRNLRNIRDVFVCLLPLTIPLDYVNVL